VASVGVLWDSGFSHGSTTRRVGRGRFMNAMIVCMPVCLGSVRVDMPVSLLSSGGEMPPGSHEGRSFDGERVTVGSGHEFHPVLENTQKLSPLQCPLLTCQRGFFRVFFRHRESVVYLEIVAGNALYRVFNSSSVCQTNDF